MIPEEYVSKEGIRPRLIEERVSVSSFVDIVTTVGNQRVVTVHQSEKRFM